MKKVGLQNKLHMYTLHLETKKGFYSKPNSFLYAKSPSGQITIVSSKIRRAVVRNFKTMKCFPFWCEASPKLYGASHDRSLRSTEQLELLYFRLAQ